MHPVMFLPLFFVLPCLGVALIVVLVVVAISLNKKKQQELAAWAAQQGLQFSATDPFGIPTRFGEFGLMRQGGCRSATNVLWGDCGGSEVIIFQYRYTVNAGKETTTYTFAACSWQLPVELKELVIRPEGFFDHVAAWFGHDRIEFESTAFNKRFHVAGADKREIYAVITPQMMEFMMQSNLENLEVRGRTALCYQSLSLNPERGRWLLGVSEGLTRLIPAQVIGNKET